MGEHDIQKAVSFLKRDTKPTTSLEEKINFLRSKLTEEELSEAVSRFNSKSEEEKAQNISQSNPLAQKSKISSSNNSSTSIPQIQYVQKPKSTGSKFVEMLNIGAISTAASLGVSYMINSVNEKKDQQAFQCMKEFQEQTVTAIQNKINELIEENNRLRESMLSENDVKMIVAKALDNQNNGDYQNNGRRNSQTNQPISLQIKGGRGRFNRGFNNSNSKNSMRDSTDSDNKNATYELCEQMNKFLKVSQEYNAEMMREMKTVNHNMSACFTTMSSALNKLSTKLEPSGGQNTGVKSSNAAKNAKPLRPPMNKSINTSSKVSSLNKSMEGRPSEELKKSKFQHYPKNQFLPSYA